jgi:hypothetical protein
MRDFEHAFVQYMVEAVWSEDGQPCRLSVTTADVRTRQLVGVVDIRVSPELWPATQTEREAFVVNQLDSIEAAVRAGRW